MTPSDLSADTKAFLERPATQAFLVAARQFVQVLETSYSDIAAFYPKAHTALLELYVAGHNLDQIELKDSIPDDQNEDINIENQNNGLMADLGEEAFYWKIFDPANPEKDGQSDWDWNITAPDATQGWLVDDFADIYLEMKAGLAAIDQINTDAAVEHALWEFKFSFAHHWGNHCISALRYLHYFYYKGKQSL